MATPRVNLLNWSTMYRIGFFPFLIFRSMATLWPTLKAFGKLTSGLLPLWPPARDLHSLTFHFSQFVFFLRYGTGNIINPIVQPIITGPFIEPMSFSQRTQKHVLTAASDLFLSWVLHGLTSYQRQLIVPDICHPYDIIGQRSSVYLSCSYLITNGSCMALSSKYEWSWRKQEIYQKTLQ